MTSAIVILISLLAIFTQVAVKAYERKTGTSLWRKIGLGRFFHLLEGFAADLLSKIHHLDAKNIATYLRQVWTIIKQFYFALQKVTAQKVADAGRMLPEDHGNRAASFYLKSIKEHKEKVLEEIPQEVLKEEEAVDGEDKDNTPA